MSSLLYRNVSLPTEGKVMFSEASASHSVHGSRGEGGAGLPPGKGGKGVSLQWGLPREGSLKLFNTPVKAGPHTAYFFDLFQLFFDLFRFCVRFRSV